MTTQPCRLSIIALPDFPAIAPEDDLARAIVDSCDRAQWTLADGDIVVLAQKIVSKSEGRGVRLADVVPSIAAIDLAVTVEKDARLVELILSESREVLRARPGVMIVEHRLGLILANAGIDASNVDHGDGEVALLLPVDPDASARRLQRDLSALTGANLAVLIIDSIGRAWRLGTVGTAIGAGGLPTLVDLRGRPDMFGRPLQTSELGFADEVAAAASLAMGQANEGTPVVIVRGLLHAGDAPATALLRDRSMDLFR